MKKRTLSLIALGLLLLTPAQAQNYRVLNDSIFMANIIAHRNAPEPRYRDCTDSLINYVVQNYGGHGAYSSDYLQISVPVSGDDEKLRRVTAHIIGELSQFTHLQQYSERIDDGTSLRGRYIAKLQPECGDTSAYVFLKYDRNLLVLKQSSNISLQMSSRTKAAFSTTNTADESLSIWQELREKYYQLGYWINGNDRIMFSYRIYESGGESLYITNPAPVSGSKTRFELIRKDDKNKYVFNNFRNKMELAGKEEGTTYGLLHNSGTLFPDTCKYYYVCHTYPNGLAEFIGITHEDSVTYLMHATSETPGLIVNRWGKTNWMTEKEATDFYNQHRAFLGIWVSDANTKKSLNTAKLTTLDSTGNVIDYKEPMANRIAKNRPVYRYLCIVQPRNYYKIKVEAKGYETGYGEIWVKDGQEPDQIEVFLKPKKK